MTIRLNREIKAYCPNFDPVRKLLRDVGATFVEVKEQVDCYYHLPAVGDAQRTRRLKSRVENGKKQLIYYYDVQKTNARVSRYQLWELRDSRILEVLDAALGIRVVVRKRREVWHKDNIIFNLDTVEGVGQIFEVEAQEEDGYDIEVQVEECRSLFGPHLGSHIPSSNEDLVMNRACS